MKTAMKLHEAQPNAVLLSSLQRVEFIPKFTPACAITIASFVKVKISDFQTVLQNEYWLLAALS